MTLLRDGAARARLPVRLSATAAYIAPSGQWCRWCPRTPSPRTVGSELFLYHLPSGLPAPREPRSDGFYLSDENLHLLRRIG